MKTTSDECLPQHLDYHHGQRHDLASVLLHTQISSAGGAPVASCACTLTDQLLFMGSWTGDSLLVRYSLDRGATATAGAAAAGPAAKRRRLSRLSSIDMGDRSGEAPGADDRALGAGRDGSSGSGAAGAGVKEEDDEVFRAAMGRAASTVVPIVAGDAMRYSLKVGSRIANTWGALPNLSDTHIV